VASRDDEAAMLEAGVSEYWLKAAKRELGTATKRRGGSKGTWYIAPSKAAWQSFLAQGLCSGTLKKERSKGINALTVPLAGNHNQSQLSSGAVD